MKNDSNEYRSRREIDNQAAHWTVQIDRGLSAEEQDAYTQWLGEDPEHRKAMVQHQWGWSELDRLSGLQLSGHLEADCDLLAPTKGFGRRRQKVARLVGFGMAGLSLVVAIATLVFVLRPGPVAETQVVEQQQEYLAPITRLERQTLDDGSQIELNRGAQVTIDYSQAERRVHLISGEANFKVAKDPARPFVVVTDKVRLRALGTEFNVRASGDEVDVIVTEGVVQLETEAEPDGDQEAGDPLLRVGQRAIVAGIQDLSKLKIFNLDPAQLEEALLWQPRLLDFDSAPLSEIVAAFNRRNAVKITVQDPELRGLSLSCTFWSDNVDGFVRLMDLSFGMRVEQRGNQILLSKSNAQ